MEAWELVRRLLLGATGGGQTFTPGMIAGQYYREFVASGQEAGISREDFIELADEFAEDLLNAGLIRPAGVRSVGAAIFGAMDRTDSGEELCGALSQRGAVQFFEGMDARIESDEIQRLLHQLNS